MSETGVNLFDYVNSKEVFVQDLYMSKYYCNIWPGANQDFDDGLIVDDKIESSDISSPLGRP